MASASGTEEQAVRKIKNPFVDKATRVDYYQLIRKWKVDLVRYGVRLTYDITVPEPGYEILSKIIDITDITKKLQKENEFNLKLEEITADNYDLKFADYNVPSSPENKPLDDTLSPPRAEADLHEAVEPDRGDSYYPIYKEIKLNVDENYTLSEIKIIIHGVQFGTRHGEDTPEFKKTFDGR